MTNADSHHARCIPMVHLKIGPLFTQITSSLSSSLSLSMNGQANVVEEANDIDP